MSTNMTNPSKPITYISKDHWKHWQAKSTEAVTINGKQAHIDLHTSKGDRGLTTTLSVCWPSDEGLTITHGVFKDYFKCLERSDVRCTSQNVERQHSKWKSKDLKQDVLDFYADKV